MRILSIEELNQIERKLTHHTTEKIWQDEPITVEWLWSEWEALADGDTDSANPQIVPGLGAVHVMTDTYTGWKKGAEDIQLVFRIVPEDGSEEFWVQKDGCYYSYDGSTWDGSFYQVQPVEVTKIEYKPVR